MPGPVRAYSFVGGWQESEYERVMRQAKESLERYFVERLSFVPLSLRECIYFATYSVPSELIPATDIEILNPETMVRDKRIDVCISYRPDIRRGACAYGQFPRVMA